MFSLGHFIWLGALAAAIVIFAVTMIQWALLRSVAYISRRLREEERS